MKCHITKLIFLFFIILLALSQVRGQSFIFEPEHTVLTDSVNAEIIFDFQLKNISTQEITVVIERTQNNVPASWSSSLCFYENCFAPFIDSISTRLGPDQAVPFSVHIFTLAEDGSAIVTVKAYDQNNESENYTHTLSANTNPASVNDESVNPESFELAQNYPNPFNPQTSIEYNLPNNAYVTLKVYDVLGNEIMTLVDEFKNKGKYKANFKSSDLTSGVYLYRLNAGNFSETKKMILEK